MFSQTWQWAKKAGASNSDAGRSIVWDKAGNVYVAGFFNGTATFGSTVVTPIGLRDIFIAKYDTLGNLIWVTKAGGLSDDECYDLCLDYLGNIFITGYFKISATFGSTTLTAVATYDIFVAKLDTAGNFIWAKRAGGNNALGDFGYSVSSDKYGNCYASGTFTGSSATFGSFTLSSTGSNEIYVAKFDGTTGNVIWAKKAGGAGADFGWCISTDTIGNSYVTGTYNTSGTFGSTTLSNANDGIFLTKLDSAGNFIWAKSAGGPADDEGYGVVIDSIGNSYVTGGFQSTATFGSFNVSSSGIFDMFVAKYDTIGNVVWVKKGGGITNDEGVGISIDKNANCYVGGYFRNTATFGSYSITSSGFQDLYAAKYDNAGNCLWVIDAGSTNPDYTYAISSGTPGTCYVTGEFNGTVSFGSTTLSAYGADDIFIGKIDSSMVTTEVNNSFQHALASGFLSFPNPASEFITISIHDFNKDSVYSIKFFNSLGQIVLELNTNEKIKLIDASNLPQGIYLLSVSSTNYLDSKKIIIQ